MPTAIVFSRGRITLPLEVRRDLGIGPGSKVDFFENADGEIVMKPSCDDARNRKAIVKHNGAPTE